MRVCPGPERTLLGGQAVGQHSKVEIQNASGTWVDLTTAGGANWVDAWTLEENIDQPVASATVTLRAEHGALSLHPLRTDSTLNRDDAAAYAPLIFGGRRLRIWTGVSAPDAAVPSTPWRLVFDGFMDEPASADNGEQIVVQGRDLGALLLDRFIEQPQAYSTRNGTDVEVIMQQILQDHTGGSPVSATLGLPGGSPNWVIREYQQPAVPVLEALRTLAQQIGWDLRYRCRTDSPDADTSELQFYDPDRAKTTADFTLPPSEYLTVDDLRFGDRNVRNVIGIWFFDRLQGGTLRYVEVKDDASIAIYGRRYMQLSEDATSNIDTETEALAMANAALADLSTPFADQQITSFDLWFAQLGDLVAFPANDVHYDQAQAFAIVSISRRWSQGTGEMSLRTRGKPSGAYSEWIRKHGKGPGGHGLPSPYFGAPVGEFSEGGGVSGDGEVWMEVRFEPYTLWVDVFVEEREFGPVPVPEVSEITRAWRLYRQKGLVGSGLFWRTFLGMATRPGWFKRIRAYGYNVDGEAGPEYIADEVQANDSSAVVDGVVSALAIAASTTSLGTSVTLDVDVGAIDPNVPSYLMIMRNGIIIAPIFLGFNGNQRVTFVDEELDPAVVYTYEVFVWTDGVSGAHLSSFQDPTGNPLPPTLPPVDTVEWVGTDPELVIYAPRGAFEMYARARFAQNVTGATKVSLQRSLDGLSGWSDVDTIFAADNFGAFYYQPTTPAWFRFRVSNATDTIEVFSVERALARKSKPITPPGTGPRFVNGSPRLNAAGDTLLFDFQCTLAGIDHVVLESSPDLISVADVDTAPGSSGQLTDSDLTTKYYRLRAEDATSGVLGYSGFAFWDGGLIPPVDGPPLILPGYPVVIDVAGTPTVQLAYTSNISWFSKMWLQASANGATWVNISPSNDAGGAFLYATVSAQWFRVRAENVGNTQALHSAPVYFPGIFPPGGSPDTAPPVFALHVDLVGGLPQLAVSWTCANVDAVVVTFEESADDGVSFGWIELFASGAVAQGTQAAGDYRDETYYRMRVKNSGGTVIATSASQYWAGQIFGA